MNKQRQQAYLHLIQNLLSCSSDEKEAEILVANHDLLGAGLLQAIENVVKVLSKRRSEKAANKVNKLRNCRNRIADAMTSTQSELRTRDFDTYLQFWQEVLQVMSQSHGDRRVVYSLLKRNTNKLNEVFAEGLRHWGTNELREAKANALRHNYPAVAVNLDNLTQLVNFGNLIQQFPLGNKASNMEIAIVAYEVALDFYTQQAFPKEWADIQNNLGTVYIYRIQNQRVENIEKAISAFNNALTVRTKSKFPLDWARTQINLGAAYINRIEEEKAENIENAIDAFNNALTIITREAFPQEWATTQNNLGNAYSNRIRGEKAENIENAIAAYNTSLKVRTKSKFSLDWANTQNNLGNAYSNRIRGEKAENIENAITAYKAALSIFTREDFPQQWAQTQINLGSNYRVRIFGNKAENIENAITAYKAALNVITREAFPQDWTTIQNNLAIAYSANWAATQNNSNVAYQDRIERNLIYQAWIIISPKAFTVGYEIEISVNIKQSEIAENEACRLQIPSTEAIANDLNIILTAPGFRFNNDNTTSLPLDPDTANISQTAIFNLTALRPGTATIQAELYCGETYKTTIETKVQVSPFEETELRPLIAARSRPVPQSDLILQIRTTWNADISTCTFNYHLDAFQPRLLFADEVDYNSQSFSANWVERSYALLKDILEKAATSQPEDFRSRLASVGEYLFQSLFSAELQKTLRTITGFKRPFTLLILADQDAWFPWELLNDGQKFLGESFIIGRWFWELDKIRPYEFPVGAVNIAHYANVEQPGIWTELLQPSGAPPPIPLPSDVLADLNYTESMGGLHLVRFGQSSGSEVNNRQNAPVQIDGSNIDDIESEVRPAKLSLRRNRPLVSLGYVSAGQSELTVLEKTWASTFIRAGCSSFVGSLWAVKANVEAAFVSSFYNSIWSGQSLGMAFGTACRLAKAIAPDSLDWLAYVLFGDPMARPYQPVEGQGYAVVEPIGQEIDDPVSPGDAVRFRVTLRRTPPVWYENRLMEVAEDLSFDDLRVFIVTSGLQVTPDDSIPMRRTTTGDYLGWFTLTVPTEVEARSVLVQVYFEDGIEPVHSLRFSLKIGNGDGE